MKNDSRWKPDIQIRSVNIMIMVNISTEVHKK